MLISDHEEIFSPLFKPAPFQHVLPLQQLLLPGHAPLPETPRSSLVDLAKVPDNIINRRRPAAELRYGAWNAVEPAQLFSLETGR